MQDIRCGQCNRKLAEGQIIMETLGIKYAVANVHGEAQTSHELVIQSWSPDALGGLF